MIPRTFTPRRVAELLFIGMVAALPAAAQESFSGARVEAVQAFLRTNFASGNAGMVIGLLDKSGSRVFSAGPLDNGTGQQVNGDTIFEIGSVTKVFTALLSLDMARRGEVKLDDPVATYLPERVKVPAYEGKPTAEVRHINRMIIKRKLSPSASNGARLILMEPSSAHSRGPARAACA
jgi:CubicO group peptidase (beta-lactamase class C family)